MGKHYTTLTSSHQHLRENYCSTTYFNGVKLTSQVRGRYLQRAITHLGWLKKFNSAHPVLFECNGKNVKKENLVSACIFIDWNNVRKAFTPPAPREMSIKIQQAIFKIQDEFAKILKNIDSTKRFKVQLRFYDGWHKDQTPTSVFLEFEKAVVHSRWSLERTIGTIYFDPDVRYGNWLACGSTRNPLYATSREGQKMVDTAIVCDFMYMLQQEIVDVGLIASDDDDFIPAVLTTEALELNGFLIRTNGHGLEKVLTRVIDSPVRYWS